MSWYERGTKKSTSLIGVWSMQLVDGVLFREAKKAVEKEGSGLGREEHGLFLL